MKNLGLKFADDNYNIRTDQKNWNLTLAYKQDNKWHIIPWVKSDQEYYLPLIKFIKNNKLTIIE